MATIEKIIALADAMRPNAFPQEVKVRWIGELDGLIALDVMGLSIDEAAQFQYDHQTDLQRQVLVKFPHDNMYQYWLCAKIDAENGEVNRYQNDMQLYNGAYLAFRTWLSNAYDPANGGGDGHGFYISAYGLAVQAGFQGSMEDWLASLAGAQGPQGEAGPQGRQGEAGPAGYSPVRGVDYYTAADQAAIVQSVLSALPKYGGEAVQV